MLGMAASGELAYSPSPRDVSQRPASRPSSQQVPHQSQWEPSASQAMHESEPIVEEDEALDRCVSRKSALERTIEMFGGRSLRSQSGNRPDTTSVDAPTETDPPQVEGMTLSYELNGVRFTEMTNCTHLLGHVPAIADIQ